MHRLRPRREAESATRGLLERHWARHHPLHPLPESPGVPLRPQDQAELAKVGTTGTPAFYINGRFLSGARPIEQFKAIIDEELKKADERIKAGTPAEKYYDEWVIGKGKKSL